MNQNLNKSRLVKILKSPLKRTFKGLAEIYMRIYSSGQKKNKLLNPQWEDFTHDLWFCCKKASLCDKNTFLNKQ